MSEGIVLEGHILGLEPDGVYQIKKFIEIYLSKGY